MKGSKIHEFLYRMTTVSKIFWFYPSSSGEESICIFWTLFQHSKLKTIENFCKPNGKLRWYKNKQEIFQGFKYHLENEGATYKLTINKLHPDDEGKYTCNVNGIETFAYLTVTRKLTLI